MNNNITLKELKKSKEKLLPQIKCLEENQMTFLWFDDFYDGPLNGVLKYQDKEYKYEIVSDYMKLEYPRIFALVALTNEELKEEKYWNDLYIELVKNQPENEESQEAFFEQQKKRKVINYGNRKVLWYYVSS